MKDKASKCCMKQRNKGVLTVQLVLYYKCYTTCCNVLTGLYEYVTLYHIRSILFPNAVQFCSFNNIIILIMSLFFEDIIFSINESHI